jgi:RNA polymerase sigma factor for flagellar operon FliA
MAGVPAAPTGEALFVSQLTVIERATSFVCSRAHLSRSDADDFGSHVKLKLIEDDYAILRKFQGRSSLRTYLTIVIQRLFLDYRISAWGKWRPSAEARRGGPVALLLEQMTVRDGHSFDEACELLKTKHDVQASRAELDRIAGRLPVRARRRFETDDSLSEVASPNVPVDQIVVEQERRVMADRVSGVLKTLMAAADPQDRLILALRFEDGRTVADIAATLRLDQKSLYRRLERLLRDLRKGFEAEGIDSRAVMEMLEGPAVDIEWEGGEPAETTTARPSLRKGTQEWR